MASTPHPCLAYFITFSCYGHKLHGDGIGTVDRRHNTVATPYLAPNDLRRKAEAERMTDPPYILDAVRRVHVLGAIRGVCDVRRWPLFAIHVRETHLHAVVHAAASPEKVMNDFKAYASRRLNEAGLDGPERKRWARHGSTRWIWAPEQAELIAHYVVHEQGEPMAVYSNPRMAEIVGDLLARLGAEG